MKPSSISNHVLQEVVAKIKAEMHETEEHDSILRDTVEGIKHFSWDTITLELQRKVPTLMQFLCLLVNMQASYMYLSPSFKFLLSISTSKVSPLKVSSHAELFHFNMLVYGNWSSKQVQIQYLFKCQLCVS